MLASRLGLSLCSTPASPCAQTAAGPANPVVGADALSGAHVMGSLADGCTERAGDAPAAAEPLL